MSGTILVVAEAGEVGLRPVSLEVVTAARKAAAAGAGDGSVTALLMGADLAGAASQLGSSGIDRLLVVDDPRLQNLPPQALAGALTCVIKRESPFAVFVASTTAGIEHAPRVAARLQLSIASDATGVSVEDGKLVVIRPVLGGRVQTAVKLEGDGTSIVTFRSGSFDKPVAAGTSVAPEPIQVEIEDADLRVQITGTAAKEIAGKGMDTADVIVGGGRGLKEASNFMLVEQLASALNGAVAATRAITDAGWRPHNEQIGQTGRVVSPRLYIAVGISGAAQHVAGLQGAEYIVAINRDPDAPIFKIASFGIVGDLFEVVPAIIAELKAIA
jgi:electron transfer flavoprotein alpha subunit